MRVDLDEEMIRQIMYEQRRMLEEAKIKISRLNALKSLAGGTLGKKRKKPKLKFPF